VNVIFDADIVGPWVCEKTGGQWVKGRGTAIGKISDGKIVAGVLYEDFNGPNILCHIACEQHSLDREFLGLIHQYPFIQLGVKRITGLVSSANKKSLRLNIKMGFEIEAVLKDACKDGDMMVLVLWKKNCRYLDDKYGTFFVKYR
jgi:RimJ/RimL family protein N-acetyltransferase